MAVKNALETFTKEAQRRAQNCNVTIEQINANSQIEKEEEIYKQEMWSKVKIEQERYALIEQKRALSREKQRKRKEDHLSLRDGGFIEAKGSTRLWN